LKNSNIDLIGKEKLSQRLQLIEARLTIQEKLNMKVNEATYDSKKLISRLLIIGGEYNQAFCFLKAFPDVVNDVVSALLVKFIIKRDDEDDNLGESEKELFPLLEKALKATSVDNINEAIQFTANAILKLQKSLSKPLELPRFLTNLAWKHDPTLLLKLYIEYELIQDAVLILDRILQSNQQLMNAPSSRRKGVGVYIEPNIISKLLEICSRDNYDLGNMSGEDIDYDEEKRSLAHHGHLKQFIISKFKN